MQLNSFLIFLLSFLLPVTPTDALTILLLSNPGLPQPIEIARLGNIITCHNAAAHMVPSAPPTSHRASSSGTSISGRRRIDVVGTEIAIQLNFFFDEL
jgi:hypothetical protein